MSVLPFVEGLVERGIYGGVLGAWVHIGVRGGPSTDGIGVGGLGRWEVWGRWRLVGGHSRAPCLPCPHVCRWPTPEMQIRDGGPFDGPILSLPRRGGGLVPFRASASHFAANSTWIDGDLRRPRAGRRSGQQGKQPVRLAAVTTWPGSKIRATWLTTRLEVHRQNGQGTPADPRHHAQRPPAIGPLPSPTRDHRLAPSAHRPAPNQPRRTPPHPSRTLDPNPPFPRTNQRRPLRDGTCEVPSSRPPCVLPLPWLGGANRRGGMSAPCEGTFRLGECVLVRRG